MEVNVFYKTKVPLKLKKTALFKSAVLCGLGKLAKDDGEVNVIIVSAREIHKINKEFLGHDYVTDVITFPYEGPQMCGDIFVCYAAAEKNAAEYNQSVLEELLTYAAHGALHLAGMDDDTPKKRAAMDAAALKIIINILP